LGGEGANLAEMTILGSEPGALASRSQWRCGEILDRLLHHCDIFAINGPGHRRLNRVDLIPGADMAS
jgi:hypothetical protein